MNYSLPKRLTVGGAEYDIRYDFRVILDIIEALEDPELSSQEKAFVSVKIFYLDYERIPETDYREAVERCFWFINGGGEDRANTGKRLVSWAQDLPYILSPVNRIVGKDVRDIPYDREQNSGGLHWWTFLSAYMEIGDCLFSQIVRVRDQRARGKKLDKAEAEWYRRNRHLVDFQQTFTDAEDSVLSSWGAK